MWQLCDLWPPACKAGDLEVEALCVFSLAAGHFKGECQRRKRGLKWNKTQQTKVVLRKWKRLFWFNCIEEDDGVRQSQKRLWPQLVGDKFQSDIVGEKWPTSKEQVSGTLSENGQRAVKPRGEDEEWALQRGGRRGRGPYWRSSGGRGGAELALRRTNETAALCERKKT